MFAKTLLSLGNKIAAASAVAMLILTALPVGNVRAANTGAQYPTGCANTGTGWSNPGNAALSDNSNATVSNGGRTMYCSFNITVPAGNVINGIEVIVEGSASGSREADVSLSWNSGGNWTNDVTTAFGAAKNNQTFGSSTDSWGHGWTIAQLTTLRVRLVSTSVFGASTISLDNVRVVVYYDLPSEIDIQGNSISIADGDTTPSVTDGTDFGNVGLNFTLDRTFTIYNTGTGTLTLSNADVSGTSSFTLLTPPAASVASGGSTTFVIRFQPNGLGGSTKIATFSVDNNDSNENPYTFEVRGVRVEAGINVQGNGNDISDGDNSPSATDGTDFGSTIVGSTVSHTFTIQNTGGGNLYLGPITFTGDFSLGTAPTSPVTAGGSTTFTVNFTPTATGVRNGTLSFINNDTNESPYNFSLRGTGLANTAPTITSNGGGATAAVSAPENTTAVTTVTATDPNAPPQVLSYSIFGGADAGLFGINGSSGVLTFNSAPNFEAPGDAGTDNVYNVTVQVSDGAGGTDTQAIAVTVTDVNEAPTDVSLSSNTVDENQPSGTPVGNLSATDPDAGATFTYSFCGGADDASFSLAGASLQTAASFDYESKNNYAICVRAADQGALTFDKNLTVNVNDVNENPTDIALSNNNVNENQPVGTAVGALSTTDPDAGDSFTYSFCGGADDGSFQITGTTLETNAIFNVLIQSSFAICVRTTDSGSLFFDKNFTISVNDINIPPIFTSSPITTANEGMLYNYGVATSDPDNDPVTITAPTIPAWLSFTDNGDGTGLLAGTPSSGDVGVHNVTLRVSDGSASTDQNFTITVGNTAPKIGANGVNSLTDTGDGVLAEFENVSVNVTKLTVTFDQDVFNVPSGDPNYAESVVNPANYMLVRDNGDGFQTTSCASGVDPLDTAITIDSITYDNNGGAGPFVSTINVNGGLPLSNGNYRLYTCGTTSISDVQDQALKLAGDGATPGTDFVRNFIVNLASNGGGNNGGQNNVNFRGRGIPVTGFTPGKITQLPQQPESAAYNKLNGIRLEIPKLGMDTQIVGINLTSKGWDLTWLGNNVGYLEGSAYPTWAGNTVLSAHVLDATNAPGPFAGIKDLQFGDEVMIHMNGQVFVYQVQLNQQVLPTNTSAVFQHENYNWVTLVTCEDYNPMRLSYNYRRMVRAVLISVLPEK